MGVIRDLVATASILVITLITAILVAFPDYAVMGAVLVMVFLIMFMLIVVPYRVITEANARHEIDWQSAALRLDGLPAEAPKPAPRATPAPTPRLSVLFGWLLRLPGACPQP